MTDTERDIIDAAKPAAKDAWMEAYRLGKNAETVDDVSLRMAEDRFERWWDREVVSNE